MDSTGKVAVGIGAGSGIGKRTALGLLESGYSVSFAGRRLKLLETTAREAGADNSSALVVPTDVTKPNSVRDLFAKTKDIFGRLDLLFNNAGTGATHSFGRHVLRAMENRR